MAHKLRQPDLTTPRDRALAMGMMVFSSIQISFGGTALRSIEEADVWQINFYRSIAFFVAIALIMTYRYRGQTFQKVRAVGWHGVTGGAMLCLAGICFLQSITNTTVANTLFMLSAIPFFTALLAYLILRERLRPTTVITMVVASFGITVMMVEGLGLGSFYGNGMGLLTALFFSGFAIIVRSKRDVDMMPALLASAGFLIVICSIVKTGDLAISTHDMLLCFLIGGVLSGTGNALFIAASRHLAAAELTLFMLLEFALGPIWVWLFIGEVPTEWTIVGGGIVILAVMIRAVCELPKVQARFNLT